MVHVAPEVLPVETVMSNDVALSAIPEVLPADVPPASPASLLMDMAGFVGRLLFFILAPLYIVASWHMLGENLLLVLLILVGFVGLIGNPNGLLKKHRWLERIILVGDGLRILQRLQGFYEARRPKSFVFYLFYPFTCLLWLPFSSFVRRELKLYAGVIITIVVALLLSAAGSYSETYPPHLTFADACGVVFVKVLLTLFAVLCLFVPVTTTNFSYQLSGKRWRMRILACVGLVSTVVTLWYFLFVFSKTMSFMSQELLVYRFKSSSSFRKVIRDDTAMFLAYEANNVDEPDDGATSGAAILPDLTEKYQSIVGKLAPKDEAKGFKVFALSVENDGKSAVWLGVWVRYSDASLRPPHLVGLLSPERVFYGSWGSLPDAVRGRFQVMSSEALGAENADPKLEHIGKAALIDDLGE